MSMPPRFTERIGEFLSPEKKRERKHAEAQELLMKYLDTLLEETIRYMSFQKERGEHEIKGNKSGIEVTLSLHNPMYDTANQTYDYLRDFTIQTPLGIFKGMVSSNDQQTWKANPLIFFPKRENILAQEGGEIGALFLNHPRLLGGVDFSIAYAQEVYQKIINAISSSQVEIKPIQVPSRT